MSILICVHTNNIEAPTVSQKQIFCPPTWLKIASFVGHNLPLEAVLVGKALGVGAEKTIKAQTLGKGPAFVRHESPLIGRGLHVPRCATNMARRWILGQGLIELALVVQGQIAEPIHKETHNNVATFGMRKFRVVDIVRETPSGASIRNFVARIENSLRHHPRRGFVFQCPPQRNPAFPKFNRGNQTLWTARFILDVPEFGNHLVPSTVLFVSTVLPILNLAGAAAVVHVTTGPAPLGTGIETTCGVANVFVRHDLVFAVLQLGRGLFSPQYLFVRTAKEESSLCFPLF